MGTTKKNRRKSKERPAERKTRGTKCKFSCRQPAVRTKEKRKREKPKQKQKQKHRTQKKLKSQANHGAVRWRLLAHVFGLRAVTRAAQVKDLAFCVLRFAFAGLSLSQVKFKK